MGITTTYQIEIRITSANFVCVLGLVVRAGKVELPISFRVCARTSIPTHHHPH